MRPRSNDVALCSAIASAATRGSGPKVPALKYAAAVVEGQSERVRSTS
jgi:hypothetical protein